MWFSFWYSRSLLCFLLATAFITYSLYSLFFIHTAHSSLPSAATPRFLSAGSGQGMPAYCYTSCEP